MGALALVVGLVFVVFPTFNVAAQFAAGASTLRVTHNETWDLVGTLLMEATFASYDGSTRNEARRLEHVAGNWKADDINAWLWGRVSNLSANSRNIISRTGYGRETVIHTRAMSFLCSPGLYPNFFPYSEVGPNGDMQHFLFSQAFNLNGSSNPQGHLTDCLVAEPTGLDVHLPANQQVLLLYATEATLNTTLRMFGQNSWVNVLSLETKAGECLAVFLRDNATDVLNRPQSGSVCTIQELNQQLCQKASGQFNLYSTYVTPGKVPFDVQVLDVSPNNLQFQIVHNQRYTGWVALLNARMQQRETLSRSKASSTEISLSIVTVLGALMGGDWVETSVHKFANGLSSRFRLHGIGKICLVAIFVGVFELAEVALEVWPLVGLTIRKHKARHVVDWSCDIGAETSAAN